MDIRTAQKILAKNRQDYDELAEEFSETRAYPWRELQELAQYVPDNGRVLDLGCGNGRLLELFKDKQIDYIGLDQSEKLIEKAKKRLLELGIKNYELRAADALDLPFKDNEFDAVFAVAVLHHIPSEELRLKVLENCRRVLKPGGFLILTAWNLWQPRLLLKYKIWPMAFGLKGSHPANGRGTTLDRKDVFIPWKSRTKGVIKRYYHAFIKGELKRLIIRAGFKIHELKSGRNFIIIAKK